MSLTAIRKENGYDPDSYTYYPIIVVGAGESGIAMGCRLQEKLGFDQYRIYERQAGIGGTWWINRYPGVACDLPAAFYSFSFAPNPRWTTLHPPGSEIVNYLHNVCEKYKIVDKIQLNTHVDEARWLEEEELWEVTLIHMRPGTGDLSERALQRLVEEHGVEHVYLHREVVRAKVLVSAVGGLVQPKSFPPDIPGQESFKGQIIHSARWDDAVDLNGKDVIVVGTGCSAAQAVPCLTKPPYNAKRVTQLMRSAPWVMPRLEAPKSWEKWSPALFSYIPGLALLLRFCIFALAEYDWRLFGGTDYNAKERKKLEASLTQYMKKNVPSKYHDILTPDYAVGCKRRVLDGGWFEALHDEKIELTTFPLTSIQPHSITLGPATSGPMVKGESKEARQIPADVIVLANGFDVGEWLHPLRIRGRNGKYLNEVWNERGGAQAYLGLAMDGFPNFFLIFGPNTVTGHSSVIMASENMVNYILKMIKPILQGNVGQMEVKRDVELAYAQEMQKALKKTVFSNGGCRNWYRSENGWNSVTYPYSQIIFTLKCMFPKWGHWDIKYTTRGFWRRRLKDVLQLMALALFAVGISKASQKGYDLRDGPALIRGVIRQGNQSAINGLEALRSRF
ncbi:MAG: hypothetical protein M1816_001897 [Peltula sp. TS41687]|nr:MAG: hypothetical protein M1816_001897 [Peltula sp. TS41687]